MDIFPTKLRAIKQKKDFSKAGMKIEYKRYKEKLKIKVNKQKLRLSKY